MFRSRFQCEHAAERLFWGGGVPARSHSVVAACAVALFLAGCAEGEGQQPAQAHQDICAQTSACPVPEAPALRVIHPTELQWHADCFSDQEIQVGMSHDLQAEGPETWMSQSGFKLSDEDLPYSIQLFAKVNSEGCEAGRVFRHVYEVRAGYPPEVEVSGTTAMAMDDPAFVDWASDWVDPVTYGEEVDDKWRTPEKALGQAQGTSTDTVTLGRGGQIAVVFQPPIRDGEGWDFAVFENSLDDSFLELAYVEVSSDGTCYVRFDHVYVGDTPLDAFDGHDTTLIGGLAGKYRGGWGTPFDLWTLANKPDVLSGQVDLQRIQYVKIVDVVGDGSENDSFGNPIYDPYPTSKSAGFDLDAVGVIHN